MWRSSMTRISRRAARGPRGTAVLGTAKLAAHTGAPVSALLGGAIVTLSYEHLLWANAMLSWIPLLLDISLSSFARFFPRSRPADGSATHSVSRPRWYGTLRRGSRSSIWGTGGLVIRGPGQPGPGRGALPDGAQRGDLPRVPPDRDLHGEAGHPRLLLSPGPPRGLSDRRLRTPGPPVGTRSPVLDRLCIPAPAAGAVDMALNPAAGLREWPTLATSLSR